MFKNFSEMITITYLDLNFTSKIFENILFIKLGNIS
jgi:hypothetical protein